MTDFVFGATIGFLLGLALGFIIGLVTVIENDENIVSAKTAIEQCQKSLPRDQVCEAVITARVVENK